ncbi:unnamed protein product [Rotaria sp. Silwood1]|nr:unnamed protein product [Rotaria sp. Silwood1]CAF1661369.1 unnamed protein product [Rotaria sp. Silwood1]CAF3804034.1 unnamed protein product [Rotaria sp. Silwood1]CAF3909458.1 unnamed protein product [Rotaria sp. Silwood1]CAF4866692.1 unnamed protein product [Rotaria sp. Silwood1]
MIGLLLLCVGLGTRSWYVEYDTTGLIAQWYTNFFTTCYALNGTCWSNANLLSSVSAYEQPITTSVGLSTDYYLRLRHAAALSILGILFVAFGVIATIILILPNKQFKVLGGRLNILAAFLFFVAALFQRAALSEGSRGMNHNGYSADLYQTGHALTMVAIPLCAFVAGRISF